MIGYLFLGLLLGGAFSTRNTIIVQEKPKELPPRRKLTETELEELNNAVYTWDEGIFGNSY